MSRVDDTTLREEALAPNESFIVEAPAGSGKTELLTQRLLALLRTVELPEQIIAITFTRKAAAEMRQRVVETLRTAAEPNPVVPAHRIRSVELARGVLARSEQLGWSLLRQCQRLRILTIDSLNSSLARQLPLLAGGISSVTIADRPDALFREAARRTTENLGESDSLSAALQSLLGLADNSLSRLETWLAESLPQRDRWIRAIATVDGPGLAAMTQASLAAIWRDRIAKLRMQIGPDLEARVLALLESRRDSGSARQEPTADAAETVSDGTGPDQRLFERWREVANLLLTAKGEWRRRFTSREGFPAADRDSIAALDNVTSACHATDGLREALAELRDLPHAHLAPAQLKSLEALTPVLRHLLAELRVLFAETGTADHTELALAAQQALGSVDAPSDLLLALDRRVEHILVDEFQDTSHLQWGLLERLTAGWEAGDGRSLFLVGDPMQSIYRFRDADLSLFARARELGIGSVRLRHIELAVNYRSAGQLVAWVNTIFREVMASAAGRTTRRPEFRSAVAGRGDIVTAGVRVHAFDGGLPGEELRRILAIVRAEVAARPAQSIGILVRSRRHLSGLRAALAGAGLHAHAVEIDSLTDTQLGQDLIALTAALTHRGDRLAWLGLLRAPWCGLSWADLNQLCGADHDGTVWSRLIDAASVERMSPDGRERIEWLRQRLEAGFPLRVHLSFGHWIRACWMLLDGPATLDNADQGQLAERYFRDLDGIARWSDLDDPAALQDLFGRPGTGADVPEQTGIEIMTIHRAKGLEFDTVVLPGLSKTTRGKRANLLLFRDIDSSSSRLKMVAAAIPDDPLTRFLQSIEREEEAEERERLLYVAATRARERLHLLAASPETSSPRSGSLLATLWPGIGTAVEARSADAAAMLPAAPTPGGTAAPASLVALPLRRLTVPRERSLPDLVDAAATGSSARPEFEWVHPASVQVGTLIHRELQRLAVRAQVSGAPVPPEVDAKRYRRELALLGVDAPDLAEAAARVAEALAKVWEDPTGRWILAPRAEAWSELRLTRRSSNRLEHLRLDRSFVDEQGRRWIIDYKTGRHLGADVEQFLDAEVERYREQLDRYAAAIAASERRPIRVGLYFPLMTTLRDWTPTLAAHQCGSE